MSRRTGERGVTLIELVVAVGVFALFIILIDAVFIGTNRSSRKAELAVDVQQNARIAAERITREIREATAAEIAVGGTPLAVVFKSARLQQDPSLRFCLYVRDTNDPLYDSRCFDNVGVPKPPYVTDPPYAAPCDTANGAPCMTYIPIWQRWIGYYLTDLDLDGIYDLRRVEGNLSTPGEALPAPGSLDSLPGSNAVATHVESFSVVVTSDRVTVILKARGTEVVQGSDLPVQEMLLPGQARTRN